MKSFTGVAKSLLMGILAIAFVFLADSRMTLAAEKTYVQNGKEYVLDTEKQTITQGDNVYSYTLNGNVYDITFPNGNVLILTANGSSYSMGWSGSHTWEDFPDYSNIENIMIRYLSAKSEQNAMAEAGIDNIMVFFIGIVFMAVMVLGGVLHAKYPEKVWQWSDGWKYEGVEPSYEAIQRYQEIGILMVVIGVIGGVIFMINAL